MKKILPLLCVLTCLISFSQTKDQSKKQSKNTPKFASFITVIDTALAQKNGFGLNGYIVNISYDRARELHGKKIKITGKVTIIKGLKNNPSPDIRAGWQDDVKYIQSPKIGIINHPATSNPEPGLSQLLFNLEYNAIDAEFRLDTASIAAIMDEGFISINENEVTGKHEELLGMYNNISSRLKDNHVIDSFYLDQFRVDQFGNTAVVTFFIVTKGRMQNVPFENRRTRFYDVWIKRNGKWKIISMQATRVTK